VKDEHIISYYDIKQLDFSPRSYYSLVEGMPPQRPNVTQKEYEALAALRYTLRQFLRFSEDAAVAAGLTPQQHQALLAIKGFAGGDWITIGEMAERLQLRHHSTVGLANRLMAQRLVARERDAKDRRLVHLVLTARGEAILEKLSAAHKEQLRRVGPQINQFLERLRGD
jgi:DNA-binding MarR family transcriptional regulator